ncbi:MAG: AIR synthase-related protein [Flavobacteriales bacterium]|nr:AIR synthase-related protein [Flavobacteriales bacterium]MCX7768260.1 AIR synthase-related protein [Flavobacteriales bacterium]MDW8410582.1 AIR synthase-related protein [Flavobacteriales bacterium]
MMSSEFSYYEKRGVSFTKSDLHQALRHADPGLYPDTFCKVLSDPWEAGVEHALLLHSDTAGTKTILAYLYWKETGNLSGFEKVVQDALVMNTDDMACAGCTGPYLASAILSRNKKCIPSEVLSTIIRAQEAFCEKMAHFGMDIHMAGGETADVGDVLRTLDVGYTLFGRLKRNQVVHIDIRPGDIVVGFASFGQCAWEEAYNSGIGANGLTSARHDLLHHKYYTLYPETFSPELTENVVYQGPYFLTDKPLQDLPDVGSLLLSPTRTYVPLIRSILNEFRDHLHGLIHCTGGGQTKVLRFLKGVCVVKDNLFPLPPLFELLRLHGKTPLAEMFQVYNMGHRLEAYIKPEIADQVIALADTLGIEARVVGHCVSSGKPGVEIHYQNERFFYSAP